MKSKPYKIVDRTSDKIIAYEMSKHPNPAYDALVKGYDLLSVKAIYID